MSQNTISDKAFQQCISPACAATFSVKDTLTACPKCGNLLDIQYEWDKLPVPSKLSDFEKYWAERSNPHRFSGVWRFHDLLPFCDIEKCITVGEGQTLCHPSRGVASYVGMESDKLFLHYEGLNPSGSFKDNGMVAACSHAKMVGATRAACASTGNTSASLAMYCSVTKKMKAIIFVGSGKIAFGKLSQALEYGALTVQLAGDFDDAMARVQEVSKELGIYLVNSVNPFRLEGQKTIMLRILERLGWEVPDWIVVPGGNLGNSSAFGKAFFELKQLGLIDRMPRIAVINASGARTLYEIVEEHGVTWSGGRPNMQRINDYYTNMDEEKRRASTIASAIEINRPVNLLKCLRALEWTDGVVRHVDDQAILDAKAQVGASGFGCEPASAASVAGAKQLVAEGVIGSRERVVCVLTGHQLKDPDATVAYHGNDQDRFDAILGSRGVQNAPFSNFPVQVANDTDAIIRVIKENG